MARDPKYADDQLHDRLTAPLELRPAGTPLTPADRERFAAVVAAAAAAGDAAEADEMRAVADDPAAVRGILKAVDDLSDQ